jgi:hypothetical protein
MHYTALHYTAGLWCVGVVLGWVLTFRTDLKLRGLWVGIICGVFTTAVLCLVSLIRTNWSQEAHLAALRTGTHGKLGRPIDDTTADFSNSSSDAPELLQQRQLHTAAAVNTTTGDLQEIELSPAQRSTSDLPV